ncbi:hypothetical protein FRC09_007695 [Ceratobasidium sp. 395]|nr:hypothetical protein FRC09_007695 [Ceratobasidium sp. 395]
MKQPPKRDKYGRLLLDPPEASPTPPAVTDTSVATSSTANRPKRPSYLEKRLAEVTGDTDEGYQELQDRIHKLAAEIIERASPSSRRHYDNAKRAFELCVSALARPTIVEDPWVADIIRKYAPEYIMFRASLTEGRKNKHVSALTIAGWFSHILVVISKHAYEPETGRKCGGVLLYKEGLAEKLENQVHSAVKKFNAVRHTLTRGKSFGIPEVTICFEYMLKSSVSRGREVRIQQMAAFVLGLATGVRPSGLFAADPEYVKEGKYMKNGDITVTNLGDTNFKLEVRIMNHKGYNNTVSGRMIPYTITPRKLIGNALIDPIWIVLHIWLQGGLGDYETLDDLILAKESVLRITKPDAPLFLASVPGGTKLLPGIPLLTGRFAEMVKDIVTAVNMAGLTFYDLRRSAADHFSNTIGSSTASLVLGHQDASSTLTEHYSYGPGNIDVLGIRTGEAEDQYLPGAESRLELRLRSGTAIRLISKAIAALGQDPQGDDEPELNDQSSEGKVALTALEEKNRKTIKSARKEAVTENTEVHALEQECIRRWDLWLEPMVPGSPLYIAAARKAKKQSQINGIKSNALYVAAIEDEDLKTTLEDREKRLRDAFKELVKVKQRVSRHAADGAKGQIASDLNKSNIDTYHDTDKAVEYSKETSSLVVDAVETSRLSGASSSKTKPTPDLPVSEKELVAAMNDDDNHVPAGELAGKCRDALNFHQGRLGKRVERPDRPSIQDIVNQAEASSNEPEPSDDELFQGGQPAEPWKDDQPETIKNTTMRDVRTGLVRIVAEPALFERECEANLARNNGQLVCPKCSKLNPETEPIVFTSVSNLRGHIRNIHTEWNDLTYDMKWEDGFKCPGVCGASRRFESIKQTREHCLSADCRDQKGFQAMKAIHDAAANRRAAARKDQPAAHTAIHARQRDRIRMEHLRYFGSLSLDDIFQLAARFEARFHQPYDFGKANPYVDPS